MSWQLIEHFTARANAHSPTPARSAETCRPRAMTNSVYTIFFCTVQIKFDNLYWKILCHPFQYAFIKLFVKIRQKLVKSLRNESSSTKQVIRKSTKKSWKIFYSTSRISGYDWITEKWRWPSDSCKYLLLNEVWVARTRWKNKLQKWNKWMLSDWISARCKFARFVMRCDGRFVA